MSKFKDFTLGGYFMAYRIVVDAGHGGDDPGAVNGNIYEKDFNDYNDGSSCRSIARTST